MRLHNRICYDVMVKQKEEMIFTDTNFNGETGMKTRLRALQPLLVLIAIHAITPLRPDL